MSRRERRREKLFSLHHQQLSASLAFFVCLLASRVATLRKLFAKPQLMLKVSVVQFVSRRQSIDCASLQLE
jgi:hypothetical protein